MLVSLCLPHTFENVVQLKMVTIEEERAEAPGPQGATTKSCTQKELLRKKRKRGERVICGGGQGETERRPPWRSKEA